MIADYWTVFLAAILPYASYLMVAFEKTRRGIYDPNNPAESNAQLEGWSRRAKSAEVNSWEALALYLAITWIAHAAGADRELLARLGAAWVVSRVAYVAAYVRGAGRARIAFWFLGIGLIVARFVVAVRA